VLDCFRHLEELGTVGYGVAGGLTPDNLLERVGPIRKRYPNCCVDVESGVRSEDGSLDILKAIHFRKQAFELFFS
jgi:phosphoribosylanthranilate isomerase